MNDIARIDQPQTHSSVNRGSNVAIRHKDFRAFDESFIKLYGFHVFAPKTDTNLTGGSVPQSYKTTIQTMPNDPVANRQVGDARMELWDGKIRVSWYTPPTSIVDETVAALKYADMMDPGGDWTFFLNDDGTLRTTDVWVVGYSIYLQWTYCPSDTMVLNFHCYRMVK